MDRCDECHSDNSCVGVVGGIQWPCRDSSTMREWGPDMFHVSNSFNEWVMIHGNESMSTTDKVMGWLTHIDESGHRTNFPVLAYLTIGDLVNLLG